MAPSRTSQTASRCWGDGSPLGDRPCFGLTHHLPSETYPTVITFVTAGDANVQLHGATVMQLPLPLGLVDEIRVAGFRSSAAPGLPPVVTG